MSTNALASHLQPARARDIFCAWLLILASFWLSAATVRAEVPANPLNQIFRKAPEFLPVEKAFPVDAAVTSEDTLAVYFEITPEYYLYRHGFAFSINGIAVDPAQWPVGEQHEDEYFGLVEIYRGGIEFQLPVPDTGPGPLQLVVGYQGCADAGLCYPPAEARFELPTAATPRAEEGKAAETQSPQQSGVAETSRSGSDAGAGPVQIQGLIWFLLAGLGLTFTPCVLPMLPILSSVILGPGKVLSTSRATALTLAYVSSMAVTFALAGVLVGYFGARLNLQAHLQNPWVIGTFAGLFVLLALSMFDLYEIRVPARLTRLSGNVEGGSLAGAAVMGAVSSLVVSPCVTAPLAGALLYIAATGDALYGGLALLALGTGMGIPLIIAGVSGGRLLPRSGPWMVGIKRIFGISMIGVAIWMLERFIAGPITLALWSALALLTAAGAHAFASEAAGRMKVVASSLAMLSFLLGGIWLTGALSGGADMWRPLGNLGGNSVDGSSFSEFKHDFTEVHDIDQLDQALRMARQQRKPVFLEVYADWCISCRILEKEVLGAARVQAALGQYTLIRADITENTPGALAILEHFQIFGPPAWIFIDRHGQELRELRVIGEISEDQFFSLLNRHKDRL